MCGRNHTYDISREGYVNLLLANQKNAKEPGDSKFMVDSRQDFLAKGYYDSLAEEINKVMMEFIAQAVVKARSEGREEAEAGAGRDRNILDIGCGTGFYSGKLKESLTKKGFGERVRIYGIDISKPAVQKASKSFQGINFCIGSSFHLPYLDESLDIIFSIFSPFDSKEVFRVLKPGGMILLTRPGESHLKELAELIYGRSELQGTPLDLSADIEVSTVKNYRLKYEIHLKDNRDIMNLVSMTPYYWHLNAENKERLDGLREYKVSMDFQLSISRKK